MSALAAAEEALSALRPSPFPLPLGRLAPAVEGAFQGIGRQGWVLCGPRHRLGAVLRGCPVERLADATAGARPYRLAPRSHAPGSRALHAVGVALHTGEPTLCLLGLSSAASGAFHEAINAAALTGAPAIFVVLVEPLGPEAPVARQLVAEPAALAQAAGLAVERVAGTAEATSNAVARAREARRPSLIQVTVE